MSTREFPLPDVGEGLTEAEIVSWRISVGDEITVNQPIVDIETAKAVVELPSPFTGRVTALLVEPGAVVPVAATLAAAAAFACAFASASFSSSVPTLEGRRLK